MLEWNYFDEISEYHEIADANNLYDAFQKSRKGSHWKCSVQKFRWNILNEIRKLQIEFDNYEKGKDNAYQLSEYSRFIVNERGKTRAITALSIRDRVVKHALNDLFLLPHVRPYLIYDNGASLEGRGIAFTRKRLLAHLRKFYQTHGSNEGYIMTVDFSGYYDNIDHEIAKEVLFQYEPDDFARKLITQAFDSYKIDVSYMDDVEYEKAKNTKFSTVEYRKEDHKAKELTGRKYLYKSLSVGDQTSQIIAVTFPTSIDNLVKIVNGCKYYGRYMDDFYIISDNIEELKSLQKQIFEKAKELKIFINPRKTNISKLSHTFKFLQFKYYLNKNGHVVIRMNSKSINRMKSKIKKLSVKVKENEVEYSKVHSMVKSWIATHVKLMSKLQIESIVNMYQDLFSEYLSINDILAFNSYK